MALVTIQNVTKQFGTQIVLDKASMDLHAGQTVGLVGANGAGKTTLFRMIAKEFPPDLGTVTTARGTEIGYLKQEPNLRLDCTLHDEVGSVFADLLDLEHRLHKLSAELAEGHDGPDFQRLMTDYDRLHEQFVAAGGHTFEQRLNEILGGLGFEPADYDRSMSVMSGGERCRAALAKMLLEDKQLLLLDEPTNHLDIDAVRWLEKFLGAHRGGAVIISHDRYLLDRLCDRIVEVANRRATNYPGNYTNYAETKARLELTQERDHEKHTTFIAKERDYIARHLAGQRSQQAKGRRTRLERQLAAGELVTDLPQRKARTKLDFGDKEAFAGTVLRCDDLAMSFGETTLFRDLTFQVRGGERLGITGPNGTGKTTLLRVLLGQHQPTGGTFEFARRLKIAYYAQDTAALDPTRTLVEEIRSIRPEFLDGAARDYLARFLFRGQDAFKLIGSLSGGEQSRVRLAGLMLSTPDVLFLDEPTNHLDIPSREVLEEALSDFSGTVITVSHDRYFLDRVVDRLLVMRREGCRHFAGNYSFYIEQLDGERSATASAAASAKKVAARVASKEASHNTSNTASPGKSKSKSKGKPKESRGPSPYDRLSAAELEAMLIERESRNATLQERFGDPAVCRDPKRLAGLESEVEALTAEIAAIDAAWQHRVGSGS